MNDNPVEPVLVEFRIVDAEGNEAKMANPASY